jgi:DNA polymerase-3 subunit delta'
MGDEQVFVVGNAEALVSQEASPEAANALLKLLEEPPAGTHLILTSSEPGRLLPTVRSRTVPLHVGRLPGETVRLFLEQEAGIDTATAKQVSVLADGSIGRALGFLPDDEGVVPLEELRLRAIELVRASLSPKQGDAFAVALSFAPTGGRSLVELLDFLDQAIRDVAAVAAGAPERAVNPEMEDLVRRAGSALQPTDATRCFAAVERCRELARGNVNPQLLVAGLTGELRHSLLGIRRSPEGISS